MSWLDKLAFHATEKLYEKPRLYKFNPCDVDCFRPLKPFGRAFQMLATQCPCCNGTRIAAAVIVAAMYPMASLFCFGVIYALLFIYAVLYPEDDHEDLGKPF